MSRADATTQHATADAVASGVRAGGALTSGHLPVAAFTHSDPTAVGFVDVDQGMVAEAADGRRWGSNHRDGLLLVRLHDQPLGVVYTDRNPSTLSADELAEVMWRTASDELLAHVAAQGCLGALDGPESLLEAGRNLTDRCAGQLGADVSTSVAVVIATCGRDEQLARCVRSLLAQRHENMEIIVVDNSPDTGQAWGAVSRLTAFGDRVRYVEEPRRGLSVARNRGVSETDAEVVAFTDDDVITDPNWLAWLLAPFADPAVRISCGMVLPLELDTPAQKRFEAYAGYCKGFEPHVYTRGSGPRPGLLLYPFINGVVGSGANMAFRRADLVAAGGFDPALGAGSPAGSCEETHAFGKIVLRGGSIAHEPRALCWHEHHRDSGALAGQIFGYGSGLGAVLTRALITDPRLYVSAARSLAIALRMRRSAGGAPAPDDAVIERPEELLAARKRGVLRGPWLYTKSVARARRLGLYGSPPAGGSNGADAVESYRER